MTRTKVSHDVFSAIGEPKRRQIIEQLLQKEMSVNQLVDVFDWPQPVVSKHLKVLKQVDLVTEQKRGRFRIYRVQPEELRPLREWIHQFEKYWCGTLDQLDTYLNDIQQGAKNGKH